MGDDEGGFLGLDAAYDAGPVFTFVDASAPALLPSCPAGPPLPATSPYDIYAATLFLYTGPNPVQLGVSAGAIAPATVAVVQGAVFAADGSPLSGASVTVLHHPELGSTRSLANGAFCLVVNGGSLLTIDVQLAGFLPSQRSVTPRLRDSIAADPIALLPLASKVTPVHLGTGMQAVVGATSLDDAGARTPMVFFPSGTTASLVLPDGGEAPLTTLSVRATEYTTGVNGVAAMPGTLPPTTSYTYAAELSVDEAASAGATGVSFSQPLPFYLDNFLGFATGSGVPVGYYDRQEGRWVGATDARVVKVLAITGGSAVLDVDGSGNPASPAALQALGIGAEELNQLATLHKAGDSLWRAQMTHFSTWDLNCGYAPPDCASTPEGAGFDLGCPDPGVYAVPHPRDPSGTNCSHSVSGSIVGCETQTLGEAVGVAGTPFVLRYDTSRAQSFTARDRLTIPLTGSVVPPALHAVTYQVNVAGVSYEGTVASPQLGPNDAVVFTWNGLDQWGRRVQSSVSAEVRIGFTYPAWYLVVPGGIGQSSWGNLGGVEATQDPARREITLWGAWSTVRFGVANYQSQFGDGWSISPVHVYDPALGIVHRGDGTDVGNVQPLTNPSVGMLNPVVVGPTATNDPPWAFAVGPDGAVWTLRGTSVDAGTGGGALLPPGVASRAVITRKPPGGPELVVRSNLGQVGSLSAGRDGNLYFLAGTSDATLQGGSEIDRLDPQGNLTKVLDSTSASGAFFYSPAADRDGRVYAFAYEESTSGPVCVARRLLSFDPKSGAQRTLNTSACKYDASNDPDRVPIAQAWFGLVTQIEVGDDGSLFFLEPEDLSQGGWLYPMPPERVRQVSPSGIVTTLYTVPAADSTSNDALFTHPTSLDSIAADPSGGVYLSTGPVNVVGASSPFETIVWYIPAAGTPPVLRVGGGGADGSGVRPLHGGSPAWNSLVGPGGAGFSPGGTGGLDVDVAGNLYVYGGGSSNSQLGVWRASGSGAWPIDYRGTAFTIPDETGTVVYAFDEHGRHLQTLDARTGSILWKFGYDNGSGLVTSIVDGDGNQTSIVRGNSGTTTIVSPWGKVTTLTIDPTTNFLQSISDPLGETVGLTYKAGTDLLETFTDPSGTLHRFTYDGFGRLQQDQSPSGSTETLTPTDGTLQTRVSVTTKLGRSRTLVIPPSSDGTTTWIRTAPDGHSAISTRSSDLTHTTTALPEGTKIEAFYSPDPRFGMQAAYASSATITTPKGLEMKMTGSRAATLTDPVNPLSATTLVETAGVNGNEWKSVTDLGTHTITTSSPAGRTTTMTLDARGRAVGLTIPGIDPISWSFDGQGRPWTLASGSLTTKLGYDAQGNLHTVTDPMGQVTTFGQDAAGRFTSVVLPDGNALNDTFDSDGNVKTYTPPFRPAHGFTVWPGDLPKTYDPPAVSGSGTTSTSFFFDGDDQLSSLNRPDGVAITPVPDPASGRLSQLQTPTGTTSFGYDPNTGQLKTVTGPGSVNLRYDYDGSLVTDVIWSGGVAGSYDLDFYPSFLVHHDGVNRDPANSVEYTYDADDLLTGAGIEVLTRDPQNGRLTGTQFAQLSDTYGYDEYGSIQSYAAKAFDGALFSVSIDQRDSSGRIQKRTETVQGVTTTYGYDYDLRGELWHVTVNGAPTATYGYDPNGNRTSVSGGATNATYDAQDRQTTHDGATFGFGPAGDLQSKTDGGKTTVYKYDALGSLLEVDLPSGDAITYVVDGAGRRVGKSKNGTLARAWLYAGGKPVAELDAQGKVTSRFVYASRGWVPDYIVQPAQTYRVFSDERGSVRLVVNITNGRVAQRLDYDEWGNVTEDSSPGFQPFGFAGGHYDPDTGLTRFGARDYDPSVGRWTSKDPALFGGGPNVYAYAFNDPIDLIDVTGRYAQASSSFNPLVQIGLELEDSGFLEGTQNLFAGATAAATFGLSNRFFARVGIVNDTCSGAYLAGEVGGGLLTAVGGLGAGEVALVEEEGFCAGGLCPCFAAGTEVDTEGKKRAIEEVSLGERVGPEGAECADPKLAEWREVDLTMEVSDHGERDELELRLLRPEEWIRKHGARVGRAIVVRLDELNVAGKATVTGIGSAGHVAADGARCPVTGWVRHTSRDVISLGIEESGETLEVTRHHRLFSADRGGWVAAGELERGEALRTKDGVVHVGASRGAALGAREVFNLEVAAAHVYYVGQRGVEAHNAYAAEGAGAVASNAANAPRLAMDLARQEAESAFTATGELSQEAIQGARQIIPPGQLGNPAIPQGFGKYATGTFNSPSGPFQMHFYMNPSTGETFYGLDFKAIFNGERGPTYFQPFSGSAP